MEKTIKVIENAQNEGVFTAYAIGGGIAALFYIEPIATFDLDIFGILPEQSSLLVSLSPIYSWFEKHGYHPDKKQVIIEGIAVQIIPVYNDLVKEGVINAEKKKYGKIITRVLGPEYMIAIMLQTFRPKDRDRLIRFLEETEIDDNRLDDILSRFNLKNNFEAFKERYFEK